MLYAVVTGAQCEDEKGECVCVTEPPDRKEKEEPPEPLFSFKQEEVEASISKFHVPAEGAKDEAPGWSRPGGCSPGGGPQADNLLAPLSDGDDAQQFLKDHPLAEGEDEISSFLPSAH